MGVRVDGKEYVMPVDLYIPPHALEVILETTFEGPLDLLLYLIRRHNLDIININVAEITCQYISYIELIGSHRFELAGEYLVMAATLAEIKSRSLLPRMQTLDDEEEDPRVRLIKQLREDVFSVCMDMPDIKQVRPQPSMQMSELVAAYGEVLKRADMYEHHMIASERLSTRECMSNLMAQLQEYQLMSFDQLFDLSQGRMGIVVTFLAMMELVKERLIKLVQVQEYGPIHVSLGSEQDSLNQELAQ